MSLKALAEAILRGNRRGNSTETTGNFMETLWKLHGNPPLINCKTIERMQQLAGVLQYEGPITRKAFIWAIREHCYSQAEAEQLISAGTGVHWIASPGVTGKLIYRPVLAVKVLPDGGGCEARQARIYSLTNGFKISHDTIRFK